MKVALTMISVLIPLVSWSECKFDNPAGLIEGKPIIRVAPIYPNKQLRKGIEGCVVLGYSLSYRSETDKRGAYASNLQVLQSPDVGARQFEKAAKKAISKWLFNANTHPVSNQTTHFSIIPFELAE